MLRRKSFEDISGFDGGWLKAKHRTSAHRTVPLHGLSAPPTSRSRISSCLNDDEIAPHTGFGLHHHENSRS